MAPNSNNTCPKCGSPIISGASYCPRCGSRIFETAEGDVSADPYIGSIIDNTFEVKSILGTGNMGIVYRAYHRVLNCDIALKVLRQDYINDRIVQARFQREAQAASSLSHPNIIHIMHYGRTQFNAPYIAMECLQGLELAALVSEQFPLAPRRTCRLASQIAHALSAAHNANIVHRDLKPANIIIVGEGENETVKVLDFGIAKITDVEGEGLTREGSVCGTPAFMSPEQVIGKNITPAADIFSFGSTLYFMLTCRLPFHGDSMVDVSRSIMMTEPTPPSQARLDCHVAPQLEAICMKALEKDPEKRYHNGTELAYAIDSIYDSLPDGIPNVKPKIIVEADYEDGEDLSGETRSVDAYEDEDDSEEAGTVVEMPAYADSSEMTNIIDAQPVGSSIGYALSQIISTIAPPKDENGVLEPQPNIVVSNDVIVKNRKRLLLGLICIVVGFCLIGAIIILIISLATHSDSDETPIKEKTEVVKEIKKEPGIDPVTMAVITHKVSGAGTNAAAYSAVYGILGAPQSDIEKYQKEEARKDEKEEAGEEEKEKAEEEKQKKDEQDAQVKKSRHRKSSSAKRSKKSSSRAKKSVGDQIKEAEKIERSGGKIKACATYKRLLGEPNLSQRDKLKLQAKIRNCSRITI